MKTTLFSKDTTMKMLVMKTLLNYSQLMRVFMKAGIILTLKKDPILTSDSTDSED